MFNVVYSNPVPPEDYKCCRCQVGGVKLWWDPYGQTIQPHCAVCSAGLEGKSIADIGDGGKHTDSTGAYTDQIGWHVPAVPFEEAEGCWAYTSVPQPGVDWWKALPTLSVADQVNLIRVTNT